MIVGPLHRNQHSIMSKHNSIFTALRSPATRNGFLDIIVISSIRYLLLTCYLLVRTKHGVELVLADSVTSFRAEQAVRRTNSTRNKERTSSIIECTYEQRVCFINDREAARSRPAAAPICPSNLLHRSRPWAFCSCRQPLLGVHSNLEKADTGR